MKLIIAEKPSLARNIAEAIGGKTGTKMQKNAGFFSDREYIVTWAFGHLFSLSDIEYYTGGAEKGVKASWTMDNLPCFPEKFNFTLKGDEGAAKQFGVIKSLCQRSDVDTIINAGDADREGEIIVRLCISNSLKDTDKKMKRLWLPDQTPETIREALNSLKDSSDYENLASEGFARTYIDWLYGTNLTRYATLRSGMLLRVGRVIVPIVKAIYDRDMQIRNFTPEKYFSIESKEETDGETVELVSDKRFPENQVKQAQELCDKYNSLPAVVTSVKSKKTKIGPGKLYSLTKLQNFLSKKYKMTMNESLSIAQSLYERGYLTYPRTNSEYLATAEKDKMRQIIASVAKLGYPVALREDKTVFDDSKIEAHSALTPTYKIPGKKDLSEREYLVYSAVFRRFAAVFCSQPCTASKTEITVEIEGCEKFSLKGTVIIDKGWMAYDDSVQKDKFLPKLKKGDLVAHKFAPIVKTTSAPKHYTVETLNNYLKNPFRKEKAASEDSENDDEDYKAVFEGLELGTEATRTGIIENALKSEYIALSKDVYTLLPRGQYLVETLEILGISMDKYKTATLGQALKKVYHGEITVDDSVKLAENEISEVFNKTAGASGADCDIGFYSETIGVCPLCSKPVRRSFYGYGCSGYKEGCKFSIPLRICKRAIPVTVAKELLSNGKSSKLDGFISKNGKPFSAFLGIDNGKVSLLF